MNSYSKCWIENQERPACFQILSFTASNIHLRTFKFAQFNKNDLKNTT